MSRILAAVYVATLILCAAKFALAQVPDDDGDVVKINTSLVQLDAVVTDQKGQPVTDLKKADFEIWQDGRRKEITNFSFVNTSIRATSAEASQKLRNESTLAPTRQRPNRTGRIITFVVDDGNCTSSLTGMDLARKALRKFVTKQMFPSDMIAIYRTRSGSGLLQQYTSDKAQLLKVIKKIRWLPAIGCSNTGDFFSAARQNDSLQEDEADPDDPNDDGVTPYERERQQNQTADDRNRDDQIVGTLGVLRYIVKGLDRIRGRKVVFLMSDGLPTLDEKGNSRQARELLGRLTEEANRSSVVLNTIDVRGVLTPGMITAADDIKLQKRNWDIQKSRTEQLSAARRNQYRSGQDSLTFLADETGGKFYRGSNDLSVHLQKAMDIEKGYYLLGYEPDEETFRGTTFHKIEIKLKRPELKVFSRRGFVGREDSKKISNRSGRGKLYDAIVAPLPNAGLGLRLSAYFLNTKKGGNFVRSLMHIEGKNIAFVVGQTGLKRAVFDVVAVTLDKNNGVVDEFTRTHSVSLEEKAIPFVRKYGLTYTTDVAVKKPGVYNFRVAVRDANSDQIGSATQVIEIPKLKKGRLYLSGLTLGEVDQNGRFDPPSSKSPENAVALIGTKGSPEIRTFKAGSRVGYSYVIYNAKSDSQTGEPRLSVTMNLFKNGKLVARGAPRAARLGLQSDWTRTKLKGYLRLAPGFVQADYAIQIIVRDLVAKRTSSQWIDFEIEG